MRPPLALQPDVMMRPLLALQLDMMRPDLRAHITRWGHGGIYMKSLSMRLRQPTSFSRNRLPPGWHRHTLRGSEATLTARTGELAGCSSSSRRHASKNSCRRLLRLGREEWRRMQ
jgi:hypothetical protein